MTGSLPDRPRRVALLVLASTWLVYLTTAGGTLGTGDAVAMFEAAKSLVDRGTLDVPREQSSDAWRGTDGRYYTPFGVGQSIYNVPFLLAGRAVVRATGVTLGDADRLPKALVAAASTLPSAIAVMYGFLLAWRLSGSFRSSLLTAQVLAFGTLLWPYSKFGFNAALSAGLLTAGLYGIAAGGLERRRAALIGGGTALGFALLTRHELSIAAVVAAAWLAWIVRRDPKPFRWLIAAGAPVCVAVLVWMTLNSVRYGSPLDAGHQPAFSLDGFPAFAWSPSGALLLYSPPAVAGVALIALVRRGPPLSRLIAGVAVGLLVFYASLEDWLGTRSYGPRYLVPLLPLLVSPLAVWIARARSRAARIAIAIVCIAGVLIQIPGILVDFSEAGIAAGQPPQTVRRMAWPWAPVWINAQAAPPAITATLQSLAQRAESVNPSAERVATAGALKVDFWWIHLVEQGLLPTSLAVLAGVLPILAAAWCARRAFHLSPDSPDHRHGLPARL